MDVWELLWRWHVEWGSKGLERKRSILLIVCMRELLECVEPGPDGVLCEGCRLSPTLSFFLSLFCFLSLFFSFLFFYFFISLSFFSFFLPLFFSSKPGLTPSWNKDTPWDGWNLKHDAMRFPPHLDFVWKSSVQCRGLLLSVFHSKEHQSVQLMQSLCSQASYVPWNS